MTTSKSILLVALSFIASISSMAAIDEPRRLLRLPNDADADRRILQSSSMSMATTESIDNVGHTMEVVNDIVSKLVEEGETIDPVLAELLVLAAVDEDEESPMHHHDDDDGYDDPEKCLQLLFIILPEYKAKKLSFICGETGTVTTSTTPAMTTSTTASSTTTSGCIEKGDPCSDSAQCCIAGKYIILLTHHIVH